jgi:hypothetical protein
MLTSGTRMRTRHMVPVNSLTLQLRNSDMTSSWIVTYKILNSYYCVLRKLMHLHRDIRLGEGSRLPGSLTTGRYTWFSAKDLCKMRGNLDETTDISKVANFKIVE